MKMESTHESSEIHGSPIAGAKWSRYLLAALLVLAACVRFYNLDERGIFDYDEAWYLLEAKTLYNTLEFAWEGVTTTSGPRPELKDYLRERGTVPITSFKPGHTLLILLSFFLLGPHDYSGFAVSATLGVLTVYLVSRLATKMFGSRVGLLAGLILAVSPFHVGYSRAGYAQANSIFFAVLAIYIWYIQYRSSVPKNRHLFAAGLSLGYAFTCHFNLFIFPPLLLLCDVLAVRRRYVIQLKRLSILAMGLVLPLLLFELPARLLRLLDRLPSGQLTYFEQYSYRSQLSRHLRFSLEGAYAFLEKLYLSEGLLLIAAITFALILGAYRFRHSFEHRFIISLLLVPALPWCILSCGLPPLYRTFAVTSPALSILAAVGLLRIVTHTERLPGMYRLVFPLTCVFVLSNGLYNLKELLPLKSTYREATHAWLNYIEKNGGRISFLPGSVWPIWYFYLSTLAEDADEVVDFYPGEEDGMPPEGDFDALDIKRYQRALKIRPDLLAYLNRTRASYRPVVRIFNPISEKQFAFSEVGGKQAKKFRDDLNQISASKTIEIYDLRSEHSKQGVVSMPNSGTKRGYQ